MTDLRNELEATFATESTEPAEEAFEQFAARQAAKGMSLEAIELARIVEDSPFWQKAGRLEWATKAIEYIGRNDPDFFERRGARDNRSILAVLQDLYEEGDRARAERDAVTNRQRDALSTLGDLVSRVEKLRKH